MVGSLHIRAISDEVANGDMDAHIKKVRNRVMMPTDMKDLLNIHHEARRNTIRECVTWLAQHHAKFKPEYLAGELATALLDNE